MFALAAARHALVAEALGDREPLDRKGEGALARHDHARERGRHLGAQRELAAGLVLEGVDLVDDLLAGLALEEFEGFDDAGVVRFEARGDGGGAPRIEDAVAQLHVLGVEIAHAARGFEIGHGV